MPNVSVPVGRILEKLDYYFSKNDYDGAKRHLDYWLGEAKLANDERGLLSLYNEYMGICRKTGEKEKAFECARKAAELTDKNGLGETESGAAVFINCATVYTAFGEPENALVFFERAKNILLGVTDADKYLTASLYNNSAAAYSDLQNFSKALACYEKALETVSLLPGNETEQALTLLNIANCSEALYGIEKAWEKIDGCVARAMSILEDEKLERNGNYAFVCVKCAPAFEYYGYFDYAKTLEERAEKIYEGT